MAGLIVDNPFRPVTQAAAVAKVLVYADSGVGKTHFLLTTPRPSIIDAENRIHLFAGRPEFGQINAYSTQDIDAVHAALGFLESGFRSVSLFDPLTKKNVVQLTPERTGVHDFLTFGLDGLTVVWEQRQFEQQTKIDRSDRQNKDAFNFADHGAMKRDYKSLMNRLILLPMNVCCTARLKEQRDPDTGKVIGDKYDAEISTKYSFDLVVKLVPAEDGGIAPDAIILKQTGNVYTIGQRVKNASWDTLVNPVIAKLQAARDAVQEQAQAVRDLVAAWRDAMAAQGLDKTAGDGAAKQIILRTTGRSSSADLTMDEISKLRAIFTSPDSLKAELQAIGAAPTPTPTTEQQQ